MGLFALSHAADLPSATFDWGALLLVRQQPLSERYVLCCTLCAVLCSVFFEGSLLSPGWELLSAVSYRLFDALSISCCFGFDAEEEFCTYCITVHKYGRDSILRV